MATPQFKIKLFSDGADLKSMFAMNDNPLVSGMTTNPSLMKKAGIRDYRAFAKELLATVTKKPVSLEVFSDEISEMERQANEIGSWGKNVYVKIPVTNSKGQSTLDLVKKLTQRGVNLNITAILTLKQIEEVCSTVKGGAPSVVSVFAGRIADTGRDPIPFMKATVEHCRKAGPQCESLWASTRELYNIVQAEQAGCSIITVPFDILEKLKMWNRDLADLSLDTVAMFKRDSEAAGFTL
jgi:transaldolase